MKLRFQLSGSVLFTTEADCIPPIGSIVRFRTEGYKKRIPSGSIISVRVTDAEPPEVDYTEGNDVVVYLSANGYEVIEEGPAPD